MEPTIMPTAVWKHEQNPSDLEVDGRKHFSDPEAIKLGYSDLEALPGPGTLEGMQSENLQAYHPDVSGKDAHGAIPYHPAASGNRDAEGAIPYYGEDEKQARQIASDQKESKRRICGLASRTFWILVTIGVLLVIAAVVGGAVGGTQASKSSTDTTKPTNGTAAASNAGIRPDSNLAAIAWTVTPTRYQYRVYYQDNDNSIKESAYDSSLGTWKVSRIVDGTGVTSGTSIAASASKQAANGTDAVDINLYFLNADLDIAVISASQGKWNSTPSNSTGQNDSKNAKLAAYYLECSQCPNTTLVAYALNGLVILYNSTTPEAWDGTVSTISSLVTALSGSEASFQPYSVSGYADQLNLYYQRTDDALVLVSWFPWDYQRDHNLDLSANSGWQYGGNNGVVGSIAPNSSFSTLYFGNSSGSPSHVDVVTSGPNWDGIQVYDWTPNAWNAVIQPEAMQNVTQSTAIAAHFYQRAYAMVNGSLTQYSVESDGTTWAINADVPTI